MGAAIRGEQWALTALFRAYHPPLVRFLRAQDRVAADDLAGDVWMAVAQGLGRFVGDERDFRGWLFTIARNRLADHRRRVARRRTSPLAPDDLVALAGPASRGDPADEVVEAMGAQDAVDCLVRELPPSQADVLLLRVVGGLDVAEVASVTGRSAGAVRVLQHRALRRLGSTLTPRAVTR